MSWDSSFLDGWARLRQLGDNQFTYLKWASSHRNNAIATLTGLALFSYSHDTSIPASNLLGRRSSVGVSKLGRRRPFLEAADLGLDLSDHIHRAILGMAGMPLQRDPGQPLSSTAT